MFFSYDIDYQKKIITVYCSSSLPTSPGYIEELEVEIDYTPTGKETMKLEKAIYQHTLPERAYYYRGYQADLNHKSFGWAI